MLDADANELDSLWSGLYLCLEALPFLLLSIPPTRLLEVSPSLPLSPDLIETTHRHLPTISACETKSYLPVVQWIHDSSVMHKG